MWECFSINTRWWHPYCGIVMGCPFSALPVYLKLHSCSMTSKIVVPQSSWLYCKRNNIQNTLIFFFGGSKYSYLFICFWVHYLGQQIQYEPKNRKKGCICIYHQSPNYSGTARGGPLAPPAGLCCSGHGVFCWLLPLLLVHHHFPQKKNKASAISDGSNQHRGDARTLHGAWISDIRKQRRIPV